MVATRTELGDDFYVFSTNLDTAIVNRWSAKGSCIIDCHGRKAILRPSFTVDHDILIRFYVHESTFLMAAETEEDGVYFVDAVHAIATRRDDQGRDVRSVEEYGLNDVCPNYVLSKQHKAHWKPSIGRYSHVGYDDIKAYLDAHPEVSNMHDIITIRNRSFSGDPTLYDFVQACRWRGYPYTTIRCCFCRGGVADFFKDKVGRGRREAPGGH
jgi:hypothetical protein